MRAPSLVQGEVEIECGEKLVSRQPRIGNKLQRPTVEQYPIDDDRPVIVDQHVGFDPALVAVVPAALRRQILPSGPSRLAVTLEHVAGPVQRDRTFDDPIFVHIERDGGGEIVHRPFADQHDGDGRRAFQIQQIGNDAVLRAPAG